MNHHPRVPQVGEVGALLSLVLDRRQEMDALTVVGISGFGGAGKSTLAAAIAAQLPSTVVVPADDFLGPETLQRSDDWSGFDRAAIAALIEVARAGGAIRYQTRDQMTGALGDWRDLGHPDVLIVEGCGIFHPDLRSYFDFTVWVDVDLETATRRGERRDRETYGSDESWVALWRTIWMPNERDFFERFRPVDHADVLYRPSDIQ